MATRKTPQGPDRPTGGSVGRLAHSDPDDRRFTPAVLDQTVIAIPLLAQMQAEQEALQKDAGLAPKKYPVIIDLHLGFPGGRDAAADRVFEILASIRPEAPATQARGGLRSASEQYLFLVLEARLIRELVKRDRQLPAKGARRKAGAPRPAIHRIWPDFPIKALLDKSVSTVKADAALNSFSTTGDKIVWAVMDSGIDALHPHFAKFANLDLSALSLRHRDLTGGTGGSEDDRDDLGALMDRLGHGTHVAGIIAGSMSAEEGDISAQTNYRDEAGEVKARNYSPPRISGMAPRCKLLSLKVLDDAGEGRASSLIEAIALIQRINGHGRHIRVHGVNMSVGYSFEPEWFACGQSPLCVEVNRLVKSGVAVVVAAGNTGYGYAQSQARGVVAAGLGLTINDPGNADLALTVGSTHREMPHVYGVSYFSSKGPTGDGRLKPDLVAPGEKIVSCASGSASPTAQTQALQRHIAGWAAATPAPAPARGRRKPVAQYREDSGTSMAAPHVSGAIAAFLSVRREFIGQPEKVKEVFLATATDLKRDRYFQGHGLVDLMRAIQSV